MFYLVCLDTPKVYLNNYNPEQQIPAEARFHYLVLVVGIFYQLLT
jgi:hypothetical protein